MPRSSPLIKSFNAGEWSPRLEGRSDLAKYPNACKVLENFLVSSIGEATRRSGTRFVKEVKTSANRTWLRRFVFNADQAYILEFGNLYIRFYTNRGIVETSPGVPLEVTTPWSTADLIAADNTINLQFIQSADVVYILHPSYEMRKLTRVTNTTWTLNTVQFQGGPFEDVNTTSTTLQATARSGAITVNASAAVFESTDVGGLIYLEDSPNASYNNWSAGLGIGAVGTIVRSDGNIYEAQTTGTCGSSKPVHTEGERNDGAVGVRWKYLHSGYGWGRITTFINSTQVYVDVQSILPDSVVSGTTTKWAFGAFSPKRGWPTHGAFFRNRLWVIRKITAYASVSADFENFRERDGAEVTADMAITLDLLGSTMDNIRWAALYGSSLIVGTEGGEFAINAVNSSDPLGPANAQATVQTGHGGRSIRPSMVDGDIMFVQRSGKRLRTLTYSLEKDGFATSDSSILADHISGKGITDMAMQVDPNRINWVVCADGTLAGYTTNKEQDVQCWARFPIGGNGIVECVETIPSPNKDRDDVWLIVRRTINGSTKRYVEYIETDFSDTSALADAFFVDSGLTYSGSPATVISGLDHLEGATIDVLADGATHPAVTVSSGQVTLNRAASKAHFGFQMVSKLQTMRIESGSADGTAQGKIKRIHSCAIRFLRTLGGKVGRSFTDMDTIQYRSAADLMDAPPPLFTGDKIIQPWQQGYDTDAYVCIMQDQPLPMTILGIMPRMDTQDGG